MVLSETHIPVASPDEEDEPGEAVAGYPPPGDHAQVLEHPQHRHHGVGVRDGARTEGELVKLGEQSLHGLERARHQL